MTENSQEVNENGPTGQSLHHVLPAVMTIEMVEEILVGLRQLPLGEKTMLTLDASQVETITTPGLQLIASLERTVCTHGGTLAVESAPDGVARAFKDAGLEGLIRKAA